MTEKIPRPVSKRLAIYYRLLRSLSKKGTDTISSSKIGQSLDLKPSQVRKDLSYFGGFGKRGTGYNVPDLMKVLEKILGVDRSWNIIIIGAGNIGLALANYENLVGEGFHLSAIVDSDPAKIGRKIQNGLSIENVNEIDAIIKNRNIEIAVLAVPAEIAQFLADKVVSSGIKGIINFAPLHLDLPKHVRLEDVHILMMFKSLSFKIVNGE